MQECDLPLDAALARATRLPAEAAGLGQGIGCLTPGTRFHAIRLRREPEGLRLIDVYG